MTVLQKATLTLMGATLVILIFVVLMLADVVTR